MRLGEVPKSCSDVTDVMMFSCFGCSTFAERHLDACARHKEGTLKVGECQLSVTVRTKRSC